MRGCRRAAVHVACKRSEEISSVLPFVSSYDVPGSSERTLAAGYGQYEVIESEKDLRRLWAWRHPGSPESGSGWIVTLVMDRGDGHVGRMQVQ